VKEHSWGLFPWAILVLALVVPNPFKAALEPAIIEQTIKKDFCVELVN
tara:strand:+ start:310 stop:453 length:144 start_codon:yes stop_codon:yes gene_type:complete